MVWVVRGFRKVYVWKIIPGIIIGFSIVSNMKVCTCGFICMYYIP